MLFVVPLLAVAVILAAAWRWGGVRTARIASDADVRAVLSAEHPSWRPTELARAVDARSALACAPPDPSVALVFAHGDVLTSRLLHAGDLLAVERVPARGDVRKPSDSSNAGGGGAVRGNATTSDSAGRSAAGRGADGAVAGQGVATRAGVGDVVAARLRLHDVGCPQVEVVLPGETWAAWAPRLQRLVGGGALLLSVATARPAVAHEWMGHGSARDGAPCDEHFRAAWTPEAPRPGTLFTVHLTTPSASAVPGARVGDESLHFRPGGAEAAGGRGEVRGASGAPEARSVDRAADDGSWTALAAVPIDAERSIALRLACPDGSGDSATIRIPLASASYPLERLRVAPRFSAPPDSALSARMAREAARAAQVSRASHETPRLWREPFSRPRPTRVTSAFGHGRVFNGSVTSRHMGTDYAGGVGAPVLAANRGIVRLVDAFYLGGNVVYLDHGEGLVTAYLHLSKQLVAEGDTVERGARIGLVGATGRVTGPHLHWIARYGRVSVDPASLLRVTATGVARTPGARDTADARASAGKGGSGRTGR